MNTYGLKRKLKRKSQRLRFLETTRKGTKEEVDNLKRGISEIKEDLRKRKNAKNTQRKQERRK